jgi:hypothetical protein
MFYAATFRLPFTAQEILAAHSEASLKLPDWFTSLERYSQTFKMLVGNMLKYVLSLFFPAFVDFCGVLVCCLVLVRIGRNGQLRLSLRKLPLVLHH